LRSAGIFSDEEVRSLGRAIWRSGCPGTARHQGVRVV
jgi:hypothetical protein